MGDRVKGKVVIVTGAGSIGPGMGNGKASAILYAREGAQVMLVDYNLRAAEETKNLIDKEGGECFTFKGDVTKSSDCRDMVKRCIQNYSRIDILHNNVGIIIPGGVVEINEENWDKVLNTNLKSMYLTCKYILPYMEVQRSGSIVNIASINAIRTLPIGEREGESLTIATAYAVSKAGVIALTRDVAIQYSLKGIRANTILPGYMDTPMVTTSLIHAYGDNIKEMKRKREGMCPMKRQGDGWDTAYAALFLASDEAKYITGTTLIVDGGITSVIR